MGSLCSRLKKKQVSENGLLSEDTGLQVPHEPEPLVIRPVVQVKAQEKVELTFRKEFAKKCKEVADIQKINTLLNSEKWIIDDYLMAQLAVSNVMEWVEQSPALALQLSIRQSETSLICHNVNLATERSRWSQLLQAKDKKSVIYGDVFRIKFLSLKKIKINSTPKHLGDQLVSLEPLALIEAPFLEELIANGHPITNIAFLRRCQWPFLSNLSLTGNAIVDSQALGAVLSGLNNVCHLEGLNISGIYSASWSNVAWILKLGFCDAELQALKQAEDSQYRKRYFGKILSRVDCDIQKNKFSRAHVGMIRKKFNNSFFENPIVLW